MLKLYISIKKVKSSASSNIFASNFVIHSSNRTQCLTATSVACSRSKIVISPPSILECKHRCNHNDFNIYVL